MVRVEHYNVFEGIHPTSNPPNKHLFIYWFKIDLVSWMIFFRILNRTPEWYSSTVLIFLYLFIFKSAFILLCQISLFSRLFAFELKIYHFSFKFPDPKPVNGLTQGTLDSIWTDYIRSITTYASYIPETSAPHRWAPFNLTLVRHASGSTCSAAIHLHERAWFF